MAAVNTRPESEAEHPPYRFWRLVLIGLLGGLLSGAFGVGGGIVMVPLLIVIAGFDQRRASATSLMAIVPTAIAGSIGYLAGGQVDFLAAGFVAAGGVAGSFLGATLLRRLPIVWLRWMFVAMLVVAALRLLLVAPERIAELELDWVVAPGLVALGCIMGIASGLFGVGGGVIAVPGLIAIFGAGDLVAKGTSLLVMIPTALMGTATNWRNRLVDLRAGATVGLAATAASFGGVALAFVIPAGLSGRLFAAIVLFSAGQLAYRAMRSGRK